MGGVEARYVKEKLRYSEGCFFSVIPRGEELCEGGVMKRHRVWEEGEGLLRGGSGGFPSGREFWLL